MGSLPLAPLGNPFTTMGVLLSGKYGAGKVPNYPAANEMPHLFLMNKLYFEMAVNSHMVVRINTKGSHASLIQFPLMVTS